MMAPQKKTGETDLGHDQPVVLSPEVENNGFAGELKNIQLDSLIQLYCLSAETITIRIHQGDYTGSVYLEKGEIVHAEAGPRSGEEAFYTIMALQGGRIETSQTEKAATRTIHKNYQFLLMEVARLSDERGWIEDDALPDATDMDSDGNILGLEEPKLRALVVDDSKLMRKIIAGMLTAEGDIEVIGTAGNGKEALAQLSRLKPDFITLDANMPVMDGLTTLKHVMIRKPCPVIVMSNLASDDQNTLTQFFNLGAVDFLPKPVKNKNMLVQQQQILSRARSAAKANVLKFKRYPLLETVNPTNNKVLETVHQPLVVFIAGIGGYHEIFHIISSMPSGLNSYYSAFQSLPKEFTASFCAGIEKNARIRTVPIDAARHLESGCCYIASLESHVVLKKSENGYCMLPDATSCSRSGMVKNMDDFFSSVVDNLSGSVHAVFLSGAEGIVGKSIEAIRGVKGKIIVQDPSSSMMPTFLEELIQKDLADITASPENIVAEVLHLIQ